MNQRLWKIIFTKNNSEGSLIIESKETPDLETAAIILANKLANEGAKFTPIPHSGNISISNLRNMGIRIISVTEYTK